MSLVILEKKIVLSYGSISLYIQANGMTIIATLWIHLFVKENKVQFTAHPICHL